LFCKELKYSEISSMFTAVIFSFSGIFICHLTHYNLVQTASFFPLVMFSTLKIYQNMTLKKRSPWIFVFIMIVSQQIFSGFPQVTFITLIWSLFLFTWFLINNRKIKTVNKLLFLGNFLIYILLSFTISAIQLAPQYEFFRISTRSNITSGESTYFSYPIKHLITFIFPYKLGDPRYGTYKNFYLFDGSVFWENTGYIGFLAVLLAIISIFLKNKNRKLFIISLLAAFVLMLGKYSPFYFIYTVPPFSLFRVPSRFILPFVFTLSIMAGYAVNVLFKRISKLKGKAKSILSFILGLILVFNIIDLLKFDKEYNVLFPWDKTIEIPDTAAFLKKSNYQGSLVSFNSEISWNKTVFSKGWKDFSPFPPYKNALVANINTLWNTKSFQVYPVQKTKRYSYFESNLLKGFFSDNQVIVISTSSAKILNMANINYLLAPGKLYLNNKEIKPIYTAGSAPEINLYKIADSQNVFFAQRSKVAKTVEDAVSTFYSSDFNPNKEVVLEKKIDISPNNNTNSNINFLKSDADKIEVDIENTNRGFLYFPITYYPYWKAQIDGKPAEILPSNINFMSVLLEPGNHKVVLQIKSKSLLIGAYISLISLIIVFLILFFVYLPKFRKSSDTR
ncbi:MAG: YfhO family protein, partial [Actinobacteria bacterium]|nr:YfhO family protein [Actinomycetota bacterium]